VIDEQRILVCGSRTWSDFETLRTILDAEPDTDVVLIHGGARGVDRLAGEYARQRGWPVEVYPADWDRHGKAAGPIRNQRMLDEGRPTEVIALTDKPLHESRGTADMVRRATRAGIQVFVFEMDNR
jgi:YspA, cpYpsA-related SLOG family